MLLDLREKVFCIVGCVVPAGDALGVTTHPSWHLKLHYAITRKAHGNLEGVSIICIYFHSGEREREKYYHFPFCF